MGCQDFLTSFSDYSDGLLGPAERESFEQHRAVCPTCDRYAVVFEKSTRAVKSLPGVEATPDFRARLEARLSEERAIGRLARSSQGSAATTSALAGVAVFLVILAWLPTLQPVVLDVTLPAIAAEPPRRPASRFRLGSTPFPGTAGVSAALDDFWGDANALLYEYSALAGRRLDVGFPVHTVGFE
ncbi:MAG: zf-HC2 domain-containing protein [Gemmatimonadota bacterium]